MEVPNGIIQLVFTSFDTANSYDWVEVSYGLYSETFSGSIIPGPFTSTGPTMTVRMHTSGEETSTGFRAVWGESSTTLLWVGDNSIVDGSNWAPGFPVPG